MLWRVAVLISFFISAYSDDHSLLIQEGLGVGSDFQRAHVEVMDMLTSARQPEAIVMRALLKSSGEMEAPPPPDSRVYEQLIELIDTVLSNFNQSNILDKEHYDGLVQNIKNCNLAENESDPGARGNASAFNDTQQECRVRQFDNFTNAKETCDNLAKVLDIDSDDPCEMTALKVDDGETFGYLAEIEGYEKYVEVCESECVVAGGCDCPSTLDDGSSHVVRTFKKLVHGRKDRYKELEEDYKGTGDTQHPNNPNGENLADACDSALEGYEAIDKECDEKQRTYEEFVCAWCKDTFATCGEKDSCYDTAKKQYLTAIAARKPLCDWRVRDTSILLYVRCVVKLWQQGKFSDLDGNCGTEYNNTKAIAAKPDYNCTYPAIPAQAPCGWNRVDPRDEDWLVIAFKPATGVWFGDNPSCDDQRKGKFDGDSIMDGKRRFIQATCGTTGQPESFNDWNQGDFDTKEWTWMSSNNEQHWFPPVDSGRKVLEDKLSCGNFNSENVSHFHSIFGDHGWF